MASPVEFKREDSSTGTEAAAHDARTQREDAIIAKAEADIDAGLGIEGGALEVWLDLLEHDPNAPLPTDTPFRR